MLCATPQILASAQHDYNHTVVQSKYTTEQQKILKLINFQQSQVTQKEFEQLAELLLKYPIFYATPKSVVGKVNSSPHLPLKPDATFTKQQASTFQVTYKIKSKNL